MCVCCLRPDEVANVLPHSGQAWDRAPICCERMCRWRLLGSVNTFLQFSHVYLRESSCATWCRMRLLFQLNTLGHWLHLYSRSPPPESSLQWANKTCSCNLSFKQINILLITSDNQILINVIYQWFKVIINWNLTLIVKQFDKKLNLENLIKNKSSKGVGINATAISKYKKCSTDWGHNQTN